MHRRNVEANANPAPDQPQKIPSDISIGFPSTRAECMTSRAYHELETSEQVPDKNEKIFEVVF